MGLKKGACVSGRDGGSGDTLVCKFRSQLGLLIIAHQSLLP